MLVDGCVRPIPFELSSTLHFSQTLSRFKNEHFQRGINTFEEQDLTVPLHFKYRNFKKCITVIDTRKVDLRISRYPPNKVVSCSLFYGWKL